MGTLTNQNQRDLTLSFRFYRLELRREEERPNGGSQSQKNRILEQIRRISARKLEVMQLLNALIDEMNRNLEFAVNVLERRGKKKD